MAEAHGKMTGKPAVCFVTRGPGATNASLGVHIAYQDSTPMVLMIGQVQRAFLDREAFQEVDFRTMFRPLAKWTAQVEDPDRIPEYVSRAWHTALSGRPGPVVLIFPEDVLYAETQVDNIPATEFVQPVAPEDTAEQVSVFLEPAERPLIIVGGSGWSEDSRKRLTEFAERNQLPVAAEFRCQDYMDNRHPNYMGDLGISTGPDWRSWCKIAIESCASVPDWENCRLSNTPWYKHRFLTRSCSMYTPILESSVVFTDRMLQSIPLQRRLFRACRT